MKKFSKQNIKIFHGLVNYGTQAGVFSHELRRMGYYSLSVSEPDRFNRLSDIKLYSGGNFIVKIIKHSANSLLKIKWFFQFDFFHFYYGKSLFPYYLDLFLYRLFS